MTDPELLYFGSISESGEIRLPGKKMRKELRALAGHEIEVRVRRKRRRTSDP